MLSFIQNISNLYHNIVVKTENVKYYFHSVGLIIIRNWYPEAINLVNLLFLCMFLERATNYLFRYMYKYFKPESSARDMKIYMSLIYLHTLIDFTNIYYQYTYLDRLSYLLPNDIIGIIPAALKIHIWLRVLSSEAKTFFYIGIGVAVAILFPIFYKYYYHFIRIVTTNLSHIRMDELQALMDRIDHSIENGVTYRIMYNRTQLIAYPGRSKTITENDLESIAPTRISNQNPPDFEHFIESECSICHEALDSNKQLYRVLPKCRHSFHCHCVDKWFFAGHNLCPLCRTSIK